VKEIRAAPVVRRPIQAMEKGVRATPELIVGMDPTPAEIEFLEDRLYDFNSHATGMFDALGLSVLGRDAQGKIVAGLCGHTWGGCCEIRQVWVHAEHRGEGTGRRLLELAEAEARRRGCFQMVLATYSFQAPEFYRKQGFEIVGSLPDCPSGDQHLQLRKDLSR
jgi:GNAT superfamily N-acetyltransferase